jgi:hypothetical protein
MRRPLQSRCTMTEQIPAEVMEKIEAFEEAIYQDALESQDTTVAKSALTASIAKALENARLVERQRCAIRARDAFEALPAVAAEIEQVILMVKPMTSEREAIERRGQRLLNGARELPYPRDQLGWFVREAWIRWAKTQPNPKSSWLLPYEELSEPDREADRQIGEAVARWTLIGDAAHTALAEEG